ncbi:MAG: nucleotidyltransferase domain-containing protein [Candidatus Gastranaerophilales bacterium]|nr:nucleotidyltransferase domain-containing protein [Candidatus Gastranaerophilales bacterium]
MNKVEKIALKLRDKLREYNDFIGLYLYGSQVSGKAKKDSDIDIVGVFKNNKDFDDSISMKILDLDLEFNVVVDFQRMTLECLNEDPLYFNEIKKGIYYAR